jgi:hypothetical protein
MPLALVRQLCAKRSLNPGYLAALCAVFGFLSLRGRSSVFILRCSFLKAGRVAGATALTWVLAEARVLRGFEFVLFGCLTFEVTCTRQRDLLDQRSIMSIARFAGPARHAVARQVHRMVRPQCDHYSSALILREAHGLAGFTSSAALGPGCRRRLLRCTKPAQRLLAF